MCVFIYKVQYTSMFYFYIYIYNIDATTPHLPFKQSHWYLQWFGEILEHKLNSTVLTILWSLYVIVIT